MRNWSSRLGIALIAFLFVTLGAESVRAQPFEVFVSIAPQKYFVERVGGRFVNVSVMVPPGASPHVYEPNPAQMRTLAQAKIYFALGVEFEKNLLPKIAALNPELQLVHTDAGIDKLSMIPHHQHRDYGHDQGKNHDHGPEDANGKSHGHDHGHGHGQGHEHAHNHGHGQDRGNEHQHHGGLDTHIWLSPDLVRIQARHILEALTALDGAHAPVYEANFKAFMADLDALDADIRHTLAGKQEAAFMVFHPAWGYFARHYGLEQIPVELEGKEPKAQDLQLLIQRAKAEGIRVVFVSPQFSTRSAETIASAIEGQTIAINPLAENWMENMRTVAEKFKQAMQ
ncbi:zinc transport system substrate-binding protein [Desulfonatronum zhilinae]|nr:zinc transport system substrate-binding protein [Desulfonatronum zhilinae]